MKRGEWAVVLALSLITILTLMGLPPNVAPESSQALASSDRALARATDTALPTLTASPTASATLTPTPRPSPTVVTATPPLSSTVTTPAATAAALASTITAPTTATAALTSTATSSVSATPTYPSVVTTTVTTPLPTPNPRPDLPRYVFVDQATQHMLVFERGKLVRDIPCSTGLPASDKYTPAWSGQIGRFVGTFFSFDTYADEAWYLYMSEGAILVHSLPYTVQDDKKIYQDREALGERPASHGCVRISPEDAVWFSAWKPEGAFMTVSDPYLDKWQWVLSK
jgi:hypothetical protein